MPSFLISDIFLFPFYTYLKYDQCMFATLRVATSLPYIYSFEVQVSNPFASQTVRHLIFFFEVQVSNTFASQIVRHFIFFFEVQVSNTFASQIVRHFVTPV